MKTLIIYSHPHEESFNHSIKESVVDALTKKGSEFDLIDLIKDNFNPVYNDKELSLFSQGKTTDSLVKKYQDMILNADHLIFIFPIWWYFAPAVTKGFIDKVMKKNFAYQSTKFGIKGQLNHIKRVDLFTTSSSPKWYLSWFAGDAIRSVFIKSLRQMGIKKWRWMNLGRIDFSSQKKREKFLRKPQKLYK